MLVRKKILTLGLVLMLLTLAGSFPLGALAETAATGEEVILYRVEKGDTFWSIGRELGLDVELIAAMNGMTPESTLPVGRILVFPTDRIFVYRVREGDNLWDISRRFKVSQEDIIQENELGDLDYLQIGQTLVIPLPVEEGEARLASGPAIQPSRGYRTAFFQWPVQGIVSSLFGPRGGRFHEGLDIAEETGAPIRAARSGRVVFAGWRGAYGNAVILDHGDGIRTLYAHASRILVAQGQYVGRGETIARIGSTGRSTGPHLHFEVLYEGTPLDPLKFLPGHE